MEANTMKMEAIKGAAFSNIELFNQLLSNETQETLDKILMFVVKEGLKPAAEVVLTHGANINACNEDGKKSALATAVSKGHKEIVELLLNQGATPQNTEILFKAIDRQRTEVVKLLLDKGFDVNCTFKDTKTTALSRAICRGNKEIVELLLDRGARHDNEALFKAISFQNDAEILKLLLDRGFDPNCVFNGKTVLCRAISMGKKEMVELLLDRGARYDNNALFNAIYFKNDAEILKLLLDKGFNANCVSNGETVLCHAINWGNKEMIELLLDRGARHDNYYLFEAIMTKDHQILKLLLNRGFDANHSYIPPSTERRFSSIAGSKMKTVLSVASRYGNKEMVKVLLDHGACINGQENEKPPIAEAVSKGDIETVELFLNRGAVHDDNVLHTAIRRGHKEIVELLLDHGANINGQENNRSTIAQAAFFEERKIVELFLNRGAELDYEALYIAIKKNSMQIVKVLLSGGYDVNYDGLQWGPLPIAIREGTKECVKLLLDYGADINHRIIYFPQPFFPIDVAVVKELEEVIKLLLDRGADINNDSTLTIATQNGNNQICKLLVRQMVLMKSENVYVRESNWALLNADLLEFQKVCDNEIELLKSKYLNDSPLSCYDFLKIKDVHKLAVLARNEGTVQLLESVTFKEDFPVYGDMIVEYFEKGKLRNEDFELITKFFNYLATRKSNRLPRMPFTFLTELFANLSSKDVDNLRETCEIVKANPIPYYLCF